MINESKILHLTLKKKWFDLIASGEKKEEYREIKDHWISIFIKDAITGESGLRHFWLNKGDLKRSECVEYIVNDIRYCNFIDPSFIEFRNGYAKDCRSLTVEFKGIKIGEARAEWSDNWPGKVFVIMLGEIIK